jgi:hypothetical protein
MKAFARCLAAPVLVFLLIGHTEAQERRGASSSGTTTRSQRGSSGGQPVPSATRSPVQSPASNSPAPGEPGANVEDRETFLRRDQLEALARQLASSGEQPKRRRFVPNIPGIPGVDGDKNLENAARLLLERQAAAEAATGLDTVVVVIGNEEDRAKVRSSLSGVQRRVVLMYLNHDFRNDQYDNTPIKGGLVGQYANQATNLWVYLPKTGAPSDRQPDRTLSTKVASSQTWTGIFGADGDLAQVTSDLSARRQTSSAGQPAAASGGTSTSAATAAFGEGDVVAPKIASVKLLAQPADDAKPVATLTKADELVVIGGEKNGFVNVQGATGAGWVKALLVSKK